MLIPPSGVNGAFVQALRSGNFRIATKVDVLSGGAVVATAPISTCVVTVDRAAQTRRRVALTIEAVPGSPLIPAAVTSTLAPFGNEIRPWFGITYADGSTEFVPLGIFPIFTAATTDTGSDLIVTIDGYDRSAIVALRKFKSPYAVAAGTDVATAIQALINSVYSGLSYSIAPTPGGSTTPAATFKEGDDPWAAAQTLAFSCGLELFFDVNGVVTGRPIPNPPSQPVAWTAAEGTPTGPTRVVNTFTRDGISNDFIVSGNGTGNVTSGPVRSVAQDNSATLGVSSAFGDVPTYTTSTLVTSTTDAQNAANNALSASVGKAQQVTIDTYPNPLLDVDDVVMVTRARVGLVNARVILDQLKLTLRHNDTCTFTGRVTT